MAKDDTANPPELRGAPTRPQRIEVVGRDIRRVPLAGGEERVYCLETGRSFAVSSWQAELVARAREPSVVLVDRSSRREIEALIAHGLLVRLDDLAAQCRRTGKPRRHPPTRTLAIVTRDRPRLLARCVESWAQHLAEHRRQPRLLVLDDSASDAVRAQARALLGRSGTGAPIAYAGREEKRAFASRLSELSGVDRDLCELAILGPRRPGATTVGANRNAMLLACAGEIVFGVDDDTTAELAVPSDLPGGDLSVSSEADPHEYWFAAGVTPVRTDLLGLHDELIGQPVAALVASAAHPSLRPSADLARSIARGEASVVMTSAGLHGAAPMTSGVDLLRLSGPSRERLLRDERSYRAALRGGPMVRIAPRVTVHDSPWAMTYAYGLDARGLLPPFLPLYRGEDDLFALVLQIVAPGAVQASLPIAVSHAPGKARAFADPLDTALEAEPVRLLRAFLEDYRARGSEPWERRTPEDAMRALGRHVQRPAALPPRAFADLVRWLRFRWTSDEVATMAQSIARHRGRPRYWQRDALAWQARVGAAMNEAPDPRTSRRFRRLLRGYGRLLYVWPMLFEAARRIGRGEGRLSDTIETVRP